MLFWFLESLNVLSSDAMGALGKITLRTSLAALISFVLAVMLGPKLIAWLSARFCEPIKSDSERVCELHEHKRATPTMGGLFIIAGLVAGVLCFADLGNPFIQISLLVAVGMAVVGAVDDLAKLRGGSNGISERAKLFGQLVVAGVASLLVYQIHITTPDALLFRVPLISTTFPLGVWFVPLSTIVIVGASNGVNLADGLDGLAGGCLIFAGGAMAVVAYVAGHAELAAYLNVPRISGAGELTVMAGAMCGGILGFLWFNCHPAQVFMGDTGSLSLGGLIGLMAVITRQEMLLVVIGGVFVVEAVSVIIQVGYFKWRRRRIFLCAPLHHHFQFQGWPESKIVVRFWIAAGLCAILGVAGLKLNIRDETTTPVPMTAMEIRTTR